MRLGLVVATVLLSACLAHADFTWTMSAPSFAYEFSGTGAPAGLNPNFNVNGKKGKGARGLESCALIGCALQPVKPSL
jgi:hypothetical protein